MPRGNPENMIPLNQRSIEEQKKIRSAAGKASGKARRNKAMLRDCLQILMEKKMLDENGNKITGAEALSVEVFQKALAGDMKAWELLRDTAGQKPIDKIEQTNTNITIDFGDIDEN
jgi:hypothetical protein